MNRKQIVSYSLSLFLFFFQALPGQQIVPADTLGRKDSVAQKLGAVEVKGHRTYVKAVDGKLQYAVAPLIKNKAIDNAYDVLRQIPGVSVKGDAVSIAGASETALIINGRLSSMTPEQVVEMLKSTPASKVKKVEVMYSAPPQYGVRGAAINVMMSNDKSSENELKGEVLLKGQQAWYFTPSARLNLSYATKTLSTDLSYSANYYQSRRADDMMAYQTLNNKAYGIDQNSTGKTVMPAHRVRGVVEWLAPDSSKWTVGYNGSFDRADSHRYASTRFSETERYATANHISGPSALHNIRVDYVGRRGLKAGVDYVHYSDRTNQELTNSAASNAASAVNSLSTQGVDKTSLYVNGASLSLRKWTIDYGMNASVSRTRSTSATLLDAQADAEASFVQEQKEQSADVFAGISRSFGERFSLQASLSLQSYRALVDSGKTERTLWKRVDVFPTLTCSYNPNANHAFQLSFSGNKKYPSYFQTSPSLIYLNVYTVTQGNPSLTPARNYSGSLNYTWLRKYMLTLFAGRELGCIQQMPYQSADLLRMNYIQINMDYRDTYGVTGEVPFKVGKVLESKFDANVVRMHDKGLLREVAFDRHKTIGSIGLDNTIYLNKAQTWVCNLSGNYSTSPIQGVYTIDPYSDVSAALMWNFAQNKARLSLRVDDMFNGQSMHTRVSIANQRSTMYLFSDSRAVTLSFRYNFSGYKKKELEEVDTSRFGGGM